MSIKKEDLIIGAKYRLRGNHMIKAEFIGFDNENYPVFTPLNEETKSLYSLWDEEAQADDKVKKVGSFWLMHGYKLFELIPEDIIKEV